MTEQIPYDVVVAFNNPKYLSMASDFGFKTGVRVDLVDNVEGSVELDFLDMDWRENHISTLLEETERLNPEYVVAGDYQTDGGNIEEVNNTASELRKFADKVIVVPHGVNQVEEIPSWCVAGYSVSSEYYDTKTPKIEFSGRDIHLLGGSPEKQIELLDYFGSDVVSLDGNYIFNTSTRFSRYWVSTRWYDGRHTALLESNIVDGNHEEASERALNHWMYALREREETNGQAKNVLDF